MRKKDKNRIMKVILVYIFMCFISPSVSAAVQKQFYHLLGLQPTASFAQIKTAYKSMAQKFHPDKFQDRPQDEIDNATKAFQMLQEIYGVLKDPNLRRRYDNGDLDESDFLKKWDSSSEGESDSSDSNGAGSGFNGSRANSNGARSGSGRSRTGSGRANSGSNGARSGSGGTGSHSHRANSHTSSKANTGNTDLHNAILMKKKYGEVTEQVEKRVLKMVRVILKSGNVNINAQNNKRQTALQIAIYKKYPGVFKLLLENGADPNIPDKDGDYPIHNVIWEQSKQSSESAFFIIHSWIDPLLLKDADFTVKNNSGKTPLELLIERNLQKTALWMIQNRGTDYLTEQDIDRLVSKAINKGQTKIVQRLRNPPQKTVRSVLTDCGKFFSKLGKWSETGNNGWAN